MAATRHRFDRRPNATAGPTLRTFEPAGLSVEPADRRFAVVVHVFLFGYLVLGRSFAQIGLAAASLFLGEVLLMAAIVDRRTRAGLTAAVRALSVGNCLHVLTWSAVLFASYGLAQVFRAMRQHAELIEALKIFAFNYYPVYIFIGIGIGLVVPDLLERLCRSLPWGVAAFVALSAAGVNVSLPLSAAIGLYAGAAGPIGILLIVCFERDLVARMPAFLACIGSWLYFQIRGDWLGVGAAIIVWAVIARRVRALIAGLAVAGLVFTTMAVADVRISASQYRGGSISAGEIFGRVVAPFNEDLGAHFAKDAEVFAGTAEWRSNFWRDIWVGVNERQESQLFGLGYGTPLSELTTFIDNDLRSPHNVFLYALGYGGWIGVGCFAFLHLAVAAALWRSFTLTGNAFGMMLWVFATLTGLFGNFFETPYNAVPYYVLIGISLAPVARREHGVWTSADGQVRLASPVRGDHLRPVTPSPAVAAGTRRAPRIEQGSSRSGSARRSIETEHEGDAQPAGERIEHQRQAHAHDDDDRQ